MTGFHWQVKQEECALFASVLQCCHPETGQFQCHCIQKEIKTGLTDIQRLAILEGCSDVSIATFSYFQLLIQQLLFRSQSSPDNGTCFVNSPLRVTQFACSHCQKISPLSSEELQGSFFNDFGQYVWSKGGTHLIILTPPHHLNFEHYYCPLSAVFRSGLHRFFYPITDRICNYICDILEPCYIISLNRQMREDHLRSFGFTILYHFSEFLSTLCDWNDTM